MQSVIKSLQKKKSFRIVFLGDSLTSTEWVHPNWREIIEYVLKEEVSHKVRDWRTASWGIRCFNSGFDGSTTPDWLDKLEAEVIELRPDLVICMGTSNDMLFNISPKQQVANLKNIFHALSQFSPEIVYCSDIPSLSKDYTNKYKPYVKEVEKLFPNKSVQFVNLFEEFAKLEMGKLFTFICPDGNEGACILPGELDFIHPNQLGNAYIAKIILKEVFDIKFNPELYIKENNTGIMFPNY